MYSHHRSTMLFPWYEAPSLPSVHHRCTLLRNAYFLSLNKSPKNILFVQTTVTYILTRSRNYLQLISKKKVKFKFTFAQPKQTKQQRTRLQSSSLPKNRFLLFFRRIFLATDEKGEGTTRDSIAANEQLKRKRKKPTVVWCAQLWRMGKQWSAFCWLSACVTRLFFLASPLPRLCIFGYV